MRIESNEVFNPITITIESRSELTNFYCVISRACDAGGLQSITELAEKLKDELDKYHCD